MTRKIWTVGEAKARLSEILRLTESEGPQAIGTRKRFMLVAVKDWLRRKNVPTHLGKHLVTTLKGAGDIPLADRSETDRANSFPIFEK